MGRCAQMMIVLAVCAMLTSVCMHAADPTIADLIKQLGHEDRKVYKAAKKALLAKGYSAYRPLAAVETDDPAVREAIDEIMEAVKFSIIPGAEGDVRQLYDALDRKETGVEAWAAIVEKAPEKVIDVIIEVGRNETRAKELHRGLKAFLRGVRPIKAAAHLAAMPKADVKAFVRHLDRANTEFYFSKYEQGLLFYCMNDYKRAVGRLDEYWKREGNSDAIALAAAAIARSRDPLTFWTIGGRRIMSSSTLSVRCKEAAFYCGIADALNKPYLVASFYDLADVGGAPAGAGSLMYEVLEKHGDEKLLDDFLNAAQGPVLKYVLLHRYFAEEKKRIPKPDLNAIILGAGGENNLMMLAKEALRIDRADAKAMLEAILNGAPFGTLYDAEARHLMGLLAQEEGRFKNAAEHIKKSVELRSKSVRNSKWMASVALLGTELEKNAALEDEAYTKHLMIGLNAEERGDEKAAEEAYRAAIAQNAKLPSAHHRLVALLTEQDRFEDAKKATKEMIANPPLTTKEHLTWSLRASQAGELEAATKWLDLYVKADPAKTNSTFYKAILEERKGNFDESAKRFEELIKRSDRYKNARRQLGLVRIKQRRLKEAEALLTEHLLRNPFDHYSRLTLSIARGLDGRDDSDDVTDYVNDLNCSDLEWSTWLLRHRAGTISDVNLLKRANSMGTKDEKYGHLCEARFCIGMSKLIGGDVESARTYLKKAYDMGITVYIEYYWARDELKRLDEK